MTWEKHATTPPRGMRAIDMGDASKARYIAGMAVIRATTSTSPLPNPDQRGTSTLGISTPEELTGATTKP